VTAGVIRFVAPVWSFGPHGDAGTSVLQSVWACAAEPNVSTIRAAAAATIARGFIADTPSLVRERARLAPRGRRGGIVEQAVERGQVSPLPRGVTAPYWPIEARSGGDPSR